MASLFTARRKPKRILRQDESPGLEDDEQDTGPVVRRPVAGSQKAKSKLRISFNPSETDLQAEYGSEHDTTVRDQKSGRTKSTNPAIQDRLHQDAPSMQVDRQLENRPSYSRAYLDELRNSTPSTPQDLSTYGTPTEEVDIAALDVAGKFGKSSLNSSNVIPSATEIREKKERRARLAKEQGASGSTAEDFISLEDYDSDGEFKPQRMQLSTFVEPEKDRDTRLVRDDDDIMEGFDDFVEDSGKVTLSRRGLKEQNRKEREQIRELIEEAEGGSSEDEDDSETERKHAYESAQTHHGMEGLSGRSTRERHSARPIQPREVTPIPKPGKALARLREMIQKVEFDRARLEKKRADLEKEKQDIIANQEHIQRSLEEAGRELERIQQKQNSDGHQAVSNGQTSISERGLESFGGREDGNSA